jgi:hypothetical protein
MFSEGKVDHTPPSTTEVKKRLLHRNDATIKRVSFSVQFNPGNNNISDHTDSCLDKGKDLRLTAQPSTWSRSLLKVDSPLNGEEVPAFYGVYNPIVLSTKSLHFILQKIS